MPGQCNEVFSYSPVYKHVQAENKEGETPLSVAASLNSGLRQLLVDVATGKANADELMHDS